MIPDTPGREGEIPGREGVGDWRAVAVGGLAGEVVDGRDGDDDDETTCGVCDACILVIQPIVDDPPIPWSVCCTAFAYASVTASWSLGETNVPLRVE